MAIWTEADVAALKVAVASGILLVRYEGPPAREIRYQNLREMRDLLGAMVADVAASAGRSSYTLAATRKGF
jgi:hypothetical protein